jgi:hypothetical protein
MHSEVLCYMRPRCGALIGWVLVSNVALTDRRNYVFSTHPNILYNRFTFHKQPTVDSDARYITALHPSLYENLHKPDCVKDIYFPFAIFGNEGTVGYLTIRRQSGYAHQLWLRKAIARAFPSWRKL